jgi:hypothetical protein
MRLGLNILATFLHSLKPRKLLSAPRNTYLPTIFARHNPRLAARAARLRASKSASRISFRTSAAAPSFTSTDTGTQHRRRRYTRSLRRSTTAAVLPAQVPSYPQPPGAFACAAAPSNADANAPDGDSTTPLAAQKVFFEELYKQRAVLMRATEERQRRVEEDAEYMRLLSEDQRKAQEALRRAEAEETQRRLEEERIEEERRLQEAIEAKERRRRRKHEAEERRRRRAAREERKEQARLEQERLEQERREQERLEQERREREQKEALCRSVAEWHRCYDEKWAVLRADVQVNPLAFVDIPWPLFGIPANAEDITLVRVQEFLCHPQREAVLSAGLVKSLRSEMLRWHPDKFNAKVLNKIMEGDREAVMEAAGKVARFLTQLTAEMKGR